MGAFCLTLPWRCCAFRLLWVPASLIAVNQQRYWTATSFRIDEDFEHRLYGNVTISWERYRTVTCSMWTMFEAKNTVPGSASPRAIYSVHWQANQCCILRYQLNCAFWSHWSRVLSLVTRWWVRLQGGLLRRELSCLMVFDAFAVMFLHPTGSNVVTSTSNNGSASLDIWALHITSTACISVIWCMICLPSQELQRIPMLASPQLL